MATPQTSADAFETAASNFHNAHSAYEFAVSQGLDPDKEHDDLHAAYKAVMACPVTNASDIADKIQIGLSMFGGPQEPYQAEINKTIISDLNSIQ